MCPSDTGYASGMANARRCSMIFGAAGAQNGHRAGPRVGSPAGLRDGLSSEPRDEPLGDVDFSGVDPVGLITQGTQYECRNHRPQTSDFSSQLTNQTPETPDIQPLHLPDPPDAPVDQPRRRDPVPLPAVHRRGYRQESYSLAQDAVKYYSG